MRRLRHDFKHAVDVTLLDDVEERPLADLGRQEWSSVFRQLVALGIIDVAHDAYGALRLTELARPV